MMTGVNIDRIHLLGIAFSLIIIISVFLLVRQRLIKEKYSLVWFFIGAFTLMMSLNTDLFHGFSVLIGVDYAPSAFFAILVAFAYLLLLNMSVSITSLNRKNKALTQELGLTKLRLEELEKKINKAEL
ncbi:hypothetical protein AXX12_04790 [Anaerosporomusa subterranea]|uniref:DUF2304 domain-containing protein n=1 Tax=Anaerosporomusa subterranea TaxID=1794912 RepID=A0A154BU30_ANASB|nr:DUF2304 domain-containing protein [Anaerosporomusa subterranea]KYZ77432.1 hypothetical protein AXX12_04790 [Anaerosporomusa subterranea]